jgi:hypothetical protein
MATPKSVNTQITDAIAESNITVITSAPAVAAASSFQAMSHSLSLAMENAVYNQQQVNVINMASTSSCAAYILGKGMATNSSKPTKQQPS